VKKIEFYNFYVGKKFEAKQKMNKSDELDEGREWVTSFGDCSNMTPYKIKISKPPAEMDPEE